MASRIPGFSPSDGKEPLPTHHVINKEEIERRLGELGGCTFDSTANAYIPIYPKRVQEAWLAQKELIREKIGQIYPKDSASIGSYLWKNSAETIDELVDYANQAKPFFRIFLQEIATALEGKTFFGKDDIYIVKTRASIEEKIERSMVDQTKMGLSPSEKRIIKLLSDSLRGTIIVKNISQCLKVLGMLRNECAIVDYDLVFSNKFEANYENGYVGVHAKIIYKYTFSGQERSVVSEVQIHFNAIEDGTPLCPSQATHALYEMSRKITSPEEGSAEKTYKKQLEAAIKLQFLIGMEKII